MNLIGPVVRAAGGGAMLLSDPHLIIWVILYSFNSIEEIKRPSSKANKTAFYRGGKAKNFLTRFNSF